jgi:hypothetical protein
MAKPTKTAPTIAEAPEAPASPEAETAPPEPAAKVKAQENEFGGPKGPEPTRYGDWERNGRCVDF